MNARTVSAAWPVSSSMWLRPTPHSQYRSLTSGVVSGTGRGNRTAIGPPGGTRGTSCTVSTASTSGSAYSALTSSISLSPGSGTTPPTRTGSPRAWALRSTVLADIPSRWPVSAAVMPRSAYSARNSAAGAVARSSRFHLPRVRAWMP